MNGLKVVRMDCSVLQDLSVPYGTDGLRECFHSMSCPRFELFSFEYETRLIISTPWHLANRCYPKDMRDFPKMMVRTTVNHEGCIARAGWILGHRLHSFIHTYTHTHTHTYIHTYIHTYMLLIIFWHLVSYSYHCPKWYSIWRGCVTWFMSINANSVHL
jgi:hypothetical protein